MNRFRVIGVKNADVYSEQQINGLLHTMLKDKTVIVIAHRQAVLSEVDQVVRLDEGKQKG